MDEISNHKSEHKIQLSATAVKEGCLGSQVVFDVDHLLSHFHITTSLKWPASSEEVLEYLWKLQVVSPNHQG